MNVNWSKYNLQLYFWIWIGLFSLSALKSQYLFPIKPTAINYLAASMGELRATHFHGGLDIKTEGREGLKVYAAQSGYVYRIRVSSYGYGKVIYLKHPDSSRTVYAHLKSFTPELEAYVVKKQYELRRFGVDLYPQPNYYTFNRGDKIGLSGNTGSSTAPHLHFEIRNAHDQPIDPQPFFYSNVRDTISPTPKSLLLTPFNKTALIEGNFTKKIVPIYKGKTGYYTKTIQAYGLIGLALEAYDKANITRNRYGIKAVQMFVDERLIYKHTIERVDYNTMKAINTFRDFEFWRTKRRNYQHLYRAAGNILPFYADSPTNGKLFIQDQQRYKIRIVITDNFQNTTTIYLTIEGNKKRTKPNQHSKILWQDKILKFSLPKADDTQLQLHYQDFTITEDAVYSDAEYHTFLHQLSDKFPNSATYAGQRVELPPVLAFISNQPKRLKAGKFTFDIPEDLAFKAFFLTFRQESERRFSLGPLNVPLRKPLKIRIKNPDFFKAAQTIIYNSKATIPVSYNYRDSSIHFKISALGTFTIGSDKIPPTIRLKRKSSQGVEFTISDRESGISHWEATIDGKWLLMYYDHKRARLWSVLNHRRPLKGKLILKVWDRAGNEDKFESFFE